MGKFIPPDWRDASAYPSMTEDWLLGPWVWSFLRRNHEYQKDYEHFAALPSYYAHGGETPKWSGRSVHEYANAELRYCKYPILPDEAVAEYVARTGDQTPYFYPLEEHLMEKWGTVGLADPADDEGSHCITFDWNLPKIIEDRYTFDHDENKRVLLEPEREELYEITLRFDLRHSIDRQLYYAKVHLMESKEGQKNEPLQLEEIRKKGVNREHFPEYLRAYDAHQAGASNIEVAKYLFPERKVELKRTKYDRNNTRDSDERKAGRAILNGKKLVNGGYKDLLEFF